MNDLFGEIDWVYRRPTDNKARYVLGVDGKNPLICIGVNPSTAEPGDLDATLIRVSRFSKQLGYDGWIMLNLYPQRATNPNELHSVSDDWLFKRNMFHCSNIVKKYKRPLTIWAAWGTLIEKRSYLSDGLTGFSNVFSADKWITIGKRSIAGHPHHPLYLPKNSEPESFNINEYIEKGKLWK